MVLSLIDDVLGDELVDPLRAVAAHALQDGARLRAALRRIGERLARLVLERIAEEPQRALAAGMLERLDHLAQLGDRLRGRIGDVVHRRGWDALRQELRAPFLRGPGTKGLG